MKKLHVILNGSNTLLMHSPKTVNPLHPLALELKKFTSKRMCMGYMPAHPSFYVRRECYERYGTFDTSYRVAADFENILRLIYINNIRTRYVAKDFVAMRMGGASSSGINSHLHIIADHFAAFRKNNLTPNYFLYFLRYVKKLFEFSRKNRAKVDADN